MKIGELALRTGLWVQTIRYYEQIGLLPRADRDGSGQRDYDTAILSWIAFIGRLKTTGMPLREMQRYAALRSRGPSAGAERLALLRAHRSTVATHLAALQASLCALDAKING